MKSSIRKSFQIIQRETVGRSDNKADNHLETQDFSQPRQSDKKKNKPNYKGIKM